MKYTYTLLFSLAIFSISFQGCTYDIEEDLNPNTECDTLSVSFSSDILPILDSNCSSCHGESYPEADLNLTEYESVASSVLTGKTLERIMLPIDDGSVMPPPPYSLLTECEIDKIVAWTNQGALEN